LVELVENKTIKNGLKIYRCGWS